MNSAIVKHIFEIPANVHDQDDENGLGIDLMENSPRGNDQLSEPGDTLGVGTNSVMFTLLNSVYLEPTVYGIVGVLLIAVAVVASGLPSLRAGRVDPLGALRAQ